jgi:hypothetical protein
MPEADAVARLRVIVIGAQKGGSTALSRALGGHPEIFLPQRELPLFEGQLFNLPNRGAVNAELALGGGRILGLKRPDMLTDPHAPTRVATSVADPLVVATLRDPVRRAVSAYYWYMQMGLLPIRDLGVGMAALLAPDSPAGARHWPRAHEVLEFGLYASGLERWTAALGGDRVLALLPEDLRTDRWRRELEIRLGLRSPLAPLEHENAGVFDPPRLRFLRVRQRLLPNAQSPTYYRERSALRYRASWQAARAITLADRAVLGRVWNGGPDGLDPVIADRLQAYYQADVDRLEAILGRPVDWR